MPPGWILGKPYSRLSMLRIVRKLPWIGRYTKQPLCNQWRPACWKPYIQRVDQAARPKSLGEASSVVGVWHTRMKLSLSSLLLVFLADKLNQACATPSSLRCCTWSVATCTVEQCPVKRKNSKSWCQEGFSVIVKKDHGGMVSWEEDTQLLARNRLLISLRLCRTAKLDLASAWNSQRSVSQSTTALMSRKILRISHAMVSTNIQPRSMLSAWQFGLSFLCVHPGRGW